MANEFMPRPGLQDLVKSAMESTLSRAQIVAEAARQFGHEVEAPVTKTASAKSDNHIPSEVCEKYASALEFLSKQAADPGSAEVASPGVGPGMGANATEVLVSNRTENIKAQNMGQAKVQPPTSPGFESDPGKSSDPTNAMATNDEMQHGEQPVDPMGNAHASNAAQKQASANLAYLQKIAKLPDAVLKTMADAAKKAPKTGAFPVDKTIKAVGGRLNADKLKQLAAQAGPSRSGAIMPGQLSVKDLLGGGGGGLGKVAGVKLSSAQLTFLRNLDALGVEYISQDKLMKIAEDAINPAQISAGPASAQGAEAPDGVSGSEDGPEPPKPGPANTQASLIGSNESAINYDKRQAKANMRSDMSNLLNEPMQASSGDSTLQTMLDHTAQSGAKIAQQQTKTAAAHALLLKLAQAQDAEKKSKKEKTSNMGGGLSTPQGQSGFSAANMM
jgi:hypothetical protein